MSMTEMTKTNRSRFSPGEDAQAEQQVPAPTARALRKELFSDELIDHLLSRVDEDGLNLTGKGGLLPEMLKAVLERGMDAELTSHLGYERGDRAGHRSGNSRNGATPKTVSTEVGDLRLDQPRDRNSSFASRLVPKGARRVGGLQDMIISLYAGGMTVRDIQHHLAATLGTELSHETISNVTEAIAGEVKEWQSRPLEAFYPVVYLDALVVKVRDGAHVANKAAHLAIGVDMDGDLARPGHLGAAERGREVLGRRVRRARQPGRQGRADCLLRRPHRAARGDRGHLEAPHRANVRGAPDPGLDAVRVLRRPQGRRGPVAPDLHGADRGRRARGARHVRRLQPGQEVPGHDRDLGARVGAEHRRSWRSGRPCARSCTRPTASSR